MTYKIVQFSADEKKFRFVSRALTDGYDIGDRLLEGVMFEITVPDGKICVKATAAAKDYLKNINSSPKKWEKEMCRYLVENKGHDDLQLEDSDEEDWNTSELHLTENISFFTDLGMTLVETETKKEDEEPEEENVDIEPKRQISKKSEPHYCSLCNTKVMVGAGTANFHFTHYEHGEIFLQVCRKCSIAISMCAC